MYHLNNFLKTNKTEIILSIVGIILFQLVRFSYIPFYLFLLTVVISVFYYYKPKLKFEIIELIPLFFYIVMIILSTIFYKNAIEKNKAILGVINAFIIPALFYIVFVVAGNNLFYRIKKVWIFVFVIALLVCIVEYLYYLLFKSYRERTISVFFNPNTFAFFLVMVYPFVLSFLKNDRQRITGTLIIFLGILLSGSRTGFLVYLLEALLINIRLVKKNIVKIFIGFGIVLSLFLPKIAYRIPKFSDIYSTKNAVGQRIFAIEFVLNYFKHRNLFEGIGPAQFESFFRSLKAPGIVALHSVHNLFLNALIEYGIIGYGMFVFLVYFLIFVTTFNMSRSKKGFDWVVFVGLICITIFQMFDMAEITNVRMVVVNLIYVYYIALVLRKFRRWRQENGKTFSF
ncbi:O-antigen ligase family protein [Caldicellulosiruptor naganoensis]|uniref:O-antigen ligase family protein n=1 Tax=Caldicellulosiruptor naganoensis TaxID=29324 RepID=A0ABY7BFP8_9FIRM|nr:O-antigen ligase family protein [Caldicellulosiruptor naganoensis]WAM30722.1 O-antigen ligase family protein [Caldicellulosiruptor naganoensis]